MTRSSIVAALSLLALSAPLSAVEEQTLAFMGR